MIMIKVNTSLVVVESTKFVKLENPLQGKNNRVSHNKWITRCLWSGERNETWMNQCASSKKIAWPRKWKSTGSCVHTGSINMHINRNDIMGITGGGRKKGIYQNCQAHLLGYISIHKTWTISSIPKSIRSQTTEVLLNFLQPGEWLSTSNLQPCPMERTWAIPLKSHGS